MRVRELANMIHRDSNLIGRIWIDRPRGDERREWARMRKFLVRGGDAFVPDGKWECLWLLDRKREPTPAASDAKAYRAQALTSTVRHATSSDLALARVGRAGEQEIS
jgi:hypothetical protein